MSITVKQYLVKVTIVAIAYCSTAWLTSSLLRLGTDASAIWLPAGIALSALLLWGERIWLGIFLGDFLLMPILGASWGLAFVSALGSTLSAIVAAKLLRYCKFSAYLARLKDILLLIFIGSIFSPIINITLDLAAHFLLVGKLDGSDFWQDWWILWLGYSTGILVMTPLLLQIGLASRQSLPKLTRRQIVEAILCFGLLGGVSLMVFAGKSIVAINQYSLEYLTFPFIIWAALRFGIVGATFASLMVSILAILGAIKGVGSFALQTPNANQTILLLQTFMAVLTITALVLSAVMSERQRAERRLRDTLERKHLLANVALRIRQSLNIEQIFNTTVAEIRHLLQADRVYIGYLQENEEAKVVAESVAANYPSVLAWKTDDLLVKDVQSSFTHSEVFIADDITKLDSSLRGHAYYQRYQIKAILAVPLVVNNQHFGLLVVHQCSRIRHWQKREVYLLQQLVIQVAIGIQQAQLYQQGQNLNSNLEHQVEERTLELQEKMEELQEFNEMKNVFLQAVSHDLRTSIMGLVMILKNLNNRPGDSISISRSILERIIHSSDRQLTLINALSEDQFSEHRQIIIHSQSLSLRELVEDILQDWQSLFVQNQAKIINLIPDNLPIIYGDPSQLRSVFDHLITNTLKHNPPGVNLTIEAHIFKGMIRCLLSDNGIGMNKDQCEKLFKLYVRSLHNQRLTGIGLGSYQCRQIIEAHSGQIGVNSTLGIGSEFWFTLPLAESSSQVKIKN